MIRIADKKSCCGCNACGDVCPTQAIVFAEDGEGFLYPKVDAAKCVGCGLCEKVCPQLHIEALKRNEWAAPKAFAAVHNNLTVRFDSTSGGAFSALAAVVYRQGGTVGGAVWTEDFHIRQVVSDKKADLPKLRSSKYAQSDARGFYAAMKAAVLTGKPVLACGTPCQMAALRAFLGKPYDNLWVVDFICRGNNSPLVFRKYLDWHEAQHGSKVVYVKPKNKELGWRNLTTKLVFSNGDVVYDTKASSYFTKGYLSTNAYCRPSCYACPYKGFPRIADITVADCWGAKELLGEAFDRDLGTSLVLVNNVKGEALFQKAATAMLHKELPLEVARQGNPMLEVSLPPPRCDRERFFATLRQEGFEGVIREFLAEASPSRGNVFKAWLRRMKMLLRRFVHRRLGWRFLCDNGPARILRGAPLLFTHAGVRIENHGYLDLRGDCEIGGGFFRSPSRPTRIGISRGGTLRLCGNNTFIYGADIEVFSGGVLEIGEDSGFNIGATLVCGERITIGRGVKAGRHVTIRDNNGGHWMNLPGYRDTKPVEIGEHVWLCEGCTIMPGVKIGAGAVVGAKAVVFNDVPPNTLVMGNPATVVCEQVEWKY